MSSTAGSIPPLHVHTQRLHDDGSLLEWMSQQHPLAFLRNGEGIVGFGSTHDMLAPTAAIAAEMWGRAVAVAHVDDEVRMPGTGLVAFGSFPFSSASAASGLLTVPAVIVGRRDGVTWITRFRGGYPLERSPLDAGFRTTFEPGEQSEAGYVASVRAAVDRIVGGEAQKVVIARDLVGSIPRSRDLRTVVARLAAAYPDTFTFAVDGLIGSSPETLVSVRGGTATARVLAGTSARGADAEADDRAEHAIANSAKDLAEHEFAVNNVLHSLSAHGSDFRSTGPYPLRLPNLWHLASDVSGKLSDGSTALDLVAALHPTAAVAGSPTDVAMALIAELEPFDRGRYAGPVGWIDANGDGEWAVALRCARFDGDTVTAYAGAGIVADSVPERELAETALKFRPIIEALAR